MPTIASMEGVAVGGGCAIAVACDLRVCADTAAFGVPVARTLGNCLSMDNCARLADLIGPARVADLLMTGRLVKAEEALAWGLAIARGAGRASSRPPPPTLARTLATRAPRARITATKAMLRRLREHRRPAPGADDDLVAACYASARVPRGRRRLRREARAALRRVTGLSRRHSARSTATCGLAAQPLAVIISRRPRR